MKKYKGDDKKNTLLLTVIAVATLLVAVVGATFAYFSLSTSGSASTTAKVTTGKVGTVTMAKGEDNLYLKVTAEEMAQEVSNDTPKDYWATKTSSPLENGGIHTENNLEEKNKIATVTLSGADKGTKYHCTAKFKITISSDDLESIKDQIVEGDGLLTLTTEATDSENVKIGIANSKVGNTETNEISHTLRSLANPIAESTDFWVIYDFTSTGSELTADLEASFKLTNTKTDQSYLAGKEITLTIASDTGSDKLTCNIVQPEE